MLTLPTRSAGAISVSLQLLAYGQTSTSLFRAGILQSGSAQTWTYRTPADLQPQFDDAARASGCADAPNVLACIRAAPLATFMAATNRTMWGPVVDGAFITRGVTDALKAGQFVKVPLLLGGEHQRHAEWDR
jgi:acetylcholinesterase